MTSLLIVAAAGLFVLYAALLVLLWRFQERVVFQPPGALASDGDGDPRQHGTTVRRVAYRAGDGAELFAYVVGDCTPGAVVVLAFHGNADLARWLVPWAAMASRETKACMILPEYRGYDGASGSPTYAASSLDARAALAFARDSLNVDASRMVFYGHSLGSAIAAELATAHPPRALVLQSPFSTARAMAARMFLPGLTAFWDIVSRVHFDTIARVRALDTPVWVSHGDRDIIVPAHMGREVFAAARQRGELLIVAGAGHNDVPDVGGRVYWRWLASAFASGDAPEPSR